MSLRRLGACATLATLAVLLTACSAGNADPAPTGAGDPTDPGGGYPVTVDNCGTEVSLEAPPERIVTIKSSTTELALALGVGDRLVGAAFLDGPFPEEIAEAGAQVPVLAERAPSSEIVLGAEPDLIFAGWESSFAADGIGERAELAALGVETYVAPAACQADGYRPDPLTFDSVFDDIIEAGELLDAREEAAALVAEQQEALAQVTPSEAGLTALWYSSGSDTPFVGGGIGAPQMIMDAVGLENIASDLDTSWGSMGWESVVAAEPDVVVLVDSAWNSADNKISVLEANPLTAALPAVQEGRYLIVDFAATEAGIRNVDAAASLAEQLDAMP
ncbi:putative F420-0 ABC transporter substrate-binding protein [Pseudactinotalea suaedae]|uniref:putative F420-0 ABC transporter substrate-binding protein n=1 Tax=Pseudactinotalea suaedae TaxID=1524924 RepID=UPI0012E30D32|nr:putative F420-0 ABC transporter substrate-binding protein [Pseudactinotalea suaedae]